MKEQLHEILMNLNRGRITVSEAHELLLNLFSVIPRSFYVVERIDEDNWEQISIGFKTYNEAIEFRDTSYNKKEYPHAFIVSSVELITKIKV